MKKILWVTLILLIVLATSLFWIVASHRRLNVNTGQLGQLTHRTVTLRGTPQNISLRVRTARLNIQAGSHYQLLMNNVINNQFDINNNERDLSITEQNHTQHQLEIGKTPVLTLIVPAKLHQLTIQQLNGTITLHNLTTDTLAVDHANGTTKIDQLTLKQSGQLTKQNGRTDITHLTSDGLHVTVKTGQFKLNGRKHTGQHPAYTQAGTHPLTINSGNGQVNVTTK